MEERNLDLEIPLRREQWEQLGRRAASLGREVAGVEWAGDMDRILVYLTDEEVDGLAADLTSNSATYGPADREVAEFVYNDGRPYAHLEAQVTAQPPNLLPQEETAIQVGLERLVRRRWHRLLRESGIHYERGHTSPEME